MHKVALIPVLGEMTFEEVEDINLAYVKSKVGGWIESVPLIGLRSNMYLNEEGKLEGLAMNVRASRLAWHEKAIGGSDYIAGDVAITGGLDHASGEDMGLSLRQEEWLKDAFKEDYDQLEGQ